MDFSSLKLIPKTEVMAHSEFLQHFTSSCLLVSIIVVMGNFAPPSLDPKILKGKIYI